MFHCLLRQGEARAVEWVDIHIFDDISVWRYEVVFGVVSVHLPKTRRQSVHSQVQHVLVEWLLRWVQLRAAPRGSCRVLNCSATGLQQCLRKLGCQLFDGVEGGVTKRLWKGASKKASTTSKQPQFLDRSHCYAHWRCLLRHSSPLWSLVTQALLLQCRPHVSIRCLSTSKQTHPTSSLHSYVPYVAPPWRPCRWLRRGVACLQQHAIWCLTLTPLPLDTTHSCCARSNVLPMLVHDVLAVGYAHSWCAHSLTIDPCRSSQHSRGVVTRNIA